MSTWKKGVKVQDYTLDEWLGQGSYGEVWKTTCTRGKIELTYALKILFTGQTDEARFLAEAESWALVCDPPHPNVNTIHFADSFHEGRVVHFAFASDYCPDGNLRLLLEENPPKREDALDLAEGILRGLAHLHAHDLVHRDLKPENILMRGNTAVLADFGTARTVRKTIDVASFAGTKHYQSGDVIRETAQNKPEDIWAAGIIVCELLGFRPFASLDDVLNSNPPVLPKDLPVPLRSFLQMALAHDRRKGKRYQDGNEMLSAFLKAKRQLQSAINQENADRATRIAEEERDTARREAHEARRAKLAAEAQAQTSEQLAAEAGKREEEAQRQLAALQLREKGRPSRSKAYGPTALVSLGIGTLLFGGMGGMALGHSWQGTASSNIGGAAAGTMTPGTGKSGAASSSSSAAGNDTVSVLNQMYTDAKGGKTEADALFRLAGLYRNGQQGITKDAAQAAALYRKSADLGNAHAMFDLGMMYQNGEGGLTQDDRKAAALYQQSADNGFTYALTNLGFMYEKGKGVPQDAAKAVAFYKKAAAAGEPVAMTDLGVMLENGGGGQPKDVAQAIVWYRKAADKGNGNAKSALARLNVH